MEFRDQQAIYLQIGDYICENILSSAWKEGDRVPSIREMAMDVEVNPNTVTRSYGYLQEQGIIRNQRGIGYFVAPGAYQQTRELKRTDFVEHELPRMFRAMDLLQMTLDDLRPYYQQRADKAAT